MFGRQRLHDRIAELEDRADSSYTDALVAAITARAGGQSTAFPTATAAHEACVGFIGRAFAAAEISGSPVLQGLLDPLTLGLCGRTLARKGEIVLLIRSDMDSGLTLLPAESHDVDGGPDPESWTYRCTVGGPARTITYEAPAESVIHLTFSRDNEKPWKGHAPLYAAQLAGRLSAATIEALANEAASPHGTILTVPVDGNDPTVAALKAGLAGMKGELHLLQGGDWDNADSGSRVGAGNLRLGASPPMPLVELAKMASMEVYAAYGLNPALFDLGTGTQARESYRQALFGVVAPLGRMVTTELRRKLDAPDLELGWTELRASDIAGRARAFQSLVGGGMDVTKAASLSGLMVADD